MRLAGNSPSFSEARGSRIFLLRTAAHSHCTPRSAGVNRIARNRGIQRSPRALEGRNEPEALRPDLRGLTLHQVATRLVQNGADLYKVKELPGHKTIAMTMRYAHHYPESLRSSVEVLDRCHNLVTLAASRVS
jgi:integrase